MEQTVEQKLKALYELQTIHTKVDKIRQVRGELPMEVADLFEQWLCQHYPLKAQHIMALVRATRDGKVYNAALGQRMTGTGHYADMLAQRFRLVCKRLHIPNSLPALRTDLFRKPVADSGQMAFDFFD